MIRLITIFTDKLMLLNFLKDTTFQWLGFWQSLIKLLSVNGCDDFAIISWRIKFTAFSLLFCFTKKKILLLQNNFLKLLNLFLQDIFSKYFYYSLCFLMSLNIFSYGIIMQVCYIILHFFIFITKYSQFS